MTSIPVHEMIERGASSLASRETAMTLRRENIEEQGARTNWSAPLPAAPLVCHLSLVVNLANTRAKGQTAQVHKVRAQLAHGHYHVDALMVAHAIMRSESSQLLRRE